MKQLDFESYERDQLLVLLKCWLAEMLKARRA